MSDYYKDKWEMYKAFPTLPPVNGGVLPAAAVLSPQDYLDIQVAEDILSRDIF